MTLRTCLLLGIFGCASSEVTNGYPPLTSGCTRSSECGGAFQCIDGGCEILACQVDLDCPNGLGCTQIVGDSQGQCMLCGFVAACDGGNDDAGSPDAGDGGRTDGG